MENENIIMELIIQAGHSRSCSMEAIRAARQHNWSAAEESLREAKDAAKKAHLIQTELIGEDEGTGKIKVTLIVVHAQDHLMNAILCKDLAEEMIAVHRQLAELKTEETE